MTAPETREPGTIITFYSYKGGTGRSMTLANVAWILASNGYRVLVVDWDLEAPGLHRYFAPFMLDPDLTESDGVIDIVNDYVAAALTKSDETVRTGDARGAFEKVHEVHGVARSGGGVGDELALRQRLIAVLGKISLLPQRLTAVLREISLRRDDSWSEPYANVLRYATSLDHTFAEYEKRKGWIDFIPAGRQGATYATRMNSFSWQNFYDRFGGGGFIERIKKRMKAEYDYVLIDSRTGVSDTSGICTVQLPDILAVCFTLNRQSIEGASSVAASVNAQRGQGRTLRIFPIPTRVEKAEKEKLDVSREVAKEAFAPVVTMSGADLDQYWGQVEVFYEPFYAYEEVLAVFGDKPLQTSSLLASMERIASWVTEGKVKQLAPAEESTRQSILAKYARQSRKVLGKGTQSGAREEYLFFVSYARADLDEQLERFVDDLSERVRAFKGLPPSSAIGFVDYIAVSGAESFPVTVTDSLQRSRVLVPIISPALLESDYAGREFQHFLGRGTPDAILPVLWTKPAAPLPPAVASIQHTDASLPDAYNNLGLSSLMRLRRYQDAYQQFVEAFAHRIVEAADRSPLLESSPDPIDELQNAFSVTEAPAPEGLDVLPEPSSAPEERPLLRQIADAIPRMDRQAVIDEIEMVIASLRSDAQAPSAEDAIELLWNLRKCRLYDVMERVANELIRDGHDTAPFRLLYAESLLAQEKTTAALAVLGGVATQPDSDERVLANALLGEAYKRLYVAAEAPSLPRNQQNLARAIKAYSEAYWMKQPEYGINAVALLMRAERDKVRISGIPLKSSPETTARELLELMEERVSKGEARASDYAVAAETCLALGEMDEVSKWIASYIQEPGVDAFELSNLLWQFTKVWQPAKSGPIERKVLPVLRAEILRRESGAITLSVSDAVDPQLLDLEKVDLQRTYGAEAFAGVAWLQNGLEYSRAVGRIEDAVTGKVYGTAFLVQGLAFERPDCPWLLVTCASVTGPDGAVPHFSVSFEGLGIKKVPVGPVLFTSAAEELDVSLYEMSKLTVADVWPYRLSSRNVQTENLRRVYTIGHRLGGDLTFSMNNNAVLDIELPRIHYSTLTGPVTAGSPVFNQDWELVAMHHAGSNQTRRLNGHLGTYEANEAIWIGAVQHAFHKESRGHARAR